EGNVPGAIGAFERTLQLDPHSAQAHNNLGVALDWKDDLDGARREFLAATKEDPRSAEAWFNLGLSYFRTGDNARANQAFAKAQTINPSASAPYTQLGQLYLKQGKRAQAVTAFQKAIALMAEDRKASRSTEAYRGLAIAYVGLGKFKEAIAVLERAVAASPQDATPVAALADARLAMGDIGGAIAEAERRLQLEPTPEARLDLASLYARKRVSAKAEPLYQAVLKEKPEDLA